MLALPAAAAASGMNHTAAANNAACGGGGTVHGEAAVSQEVAHEGVSEDCSSHPDRPTFSTSSAAGAFLKQAQQQMHSAGSQSKQPPGRQQSAKELQQTPSFSCEQRQQPEGEQKDGQLAEQADGQPPAAAAVQSSPEGQHPAAASGAAPANMLLGSHYEHFLVPKDREDVLPELFLCLEVRIKFLSASCKAAGPHPSLPPTPRPLPSPPLLDRAR